MNVGMATEGFDFVRETERRGTNSMKWNVAAGELPMWVADMDFEACPAVRQAVEARAAHGIFGYADIPAGFGQTVADWWARRHGLEVAPETVVFATGVVPVLSCAVRALANVYENVLVTPPVYGIFYNSIRNSGRTILESPLRQTRGPDGAPLFGFDWEDLESKIADPQTSLMLLCNPHNPAGTIWSGEELARLGELAEKHHVAVVSDEIHCDIVAPGVRHTPFMAASPACARVGITAGSASKAFNLAGLQGAYVFSANPFLAHRIERELNTSETAEPNVFAVEATMAAYRDGEAWLDALRKALWENRARVEAAIESWGLGLRVVRSGATYLAWIDCRSVLGLAELPRSCRGQACSSGRSALGAALAGSDPAVTLPATSRELARFLRSETGLRLSAGTDFGTGGEGYLRMNLATQPSRIADGLARLEAGLRAWTARA